jgi:hypothetical protein
MTKMEDLRQTATPLDRFLHASVGNDRNGNSVTVLSTFARLGLDPWQEAADLARLTQENARLRLGGRLARFRDVAASDAGATVQRLLDLLPPPALHPGRGSPTSASRVTPHGFGPILAIAAVLVLLLQAVFGNSGGSGD